jgi:hypothetical protein
MRTTLQIDDDVLAEAREVSRRERRGLGAVISDLARRSLRPVGIRSEDGFPVFDVADDAPTMTADAVARARDED